MKIIFMGTPLFALETLKALHKSNHEILAVVTKQDKPVGRKKILTSPPVKIFSEEKNIKILQPESIKTQEIFKEFKELNPDVIVVVAYGKILPSNILDVPKHGCINVHASLLPKYRGAAPIAWSIVRGEKITGITTMQMNKGLDTGNIFLQEKVAISENETTEELCNRLSLIGANLLIKTLDGISKKNLKTRKQNENEATFAPIIKKEFSVIDWSKSAEEIHNLVRGFIPWPCARTTLNGKILKILETRKNSFKNNLEIGCIAEFNPLLITCNNGECLEILKLQLEGKNAVHAKDFVRGNLKKNDKFGT